MKRANGTGTIVKLSGNRRKPYAVRVPARDRRGYVCQKTLSYHTKQIEAQAALEEYNRNLREGAAPAAEKLSMTVQSVYDLWSARKYEKAGKASVASYRASWARLEPLAGLKMRDITIDHLQGVIDSGEAAGLSRSSLSNDKVLMRALYKFAMERDIVAKDYSAFVTLPAAEAKYEKGAFSELQVKKLEQMAAAGVPWADTVLMLCYTGFRISEFLSLTPFSYDRDGDYLRGGMKTEAGKNRVVPVHPKIKPYLLRWLERGGETIICTVNGKRLSDKVYRSSLFRPIAEALGVPQATPHWCRHTFATRLHAAGAQELEQKRLLGHANKDVTEHYTHTDLEQLRAAIRLLA